MSDKASPPEPRERSNRIIEAYDRFNGVEKRDSLRWRALIVLALLLAIGLFALTFIDATVLLADKPFKLAARCLLLATMLFVAHCWCLQLRLARTRRELASDLAVIAASETLTAAVSGMPAGADRRVLSRMVCDEKLAVIPVEPGNSAHLYGRIVDITEDGLGAIIPTELTPGLHAVLEFSLAGLKTEHPASLIRVEAVLRQRNGFRYGFSFVQMNDSGRNVITSYRKNNNVINIAARGQGAD